MNLQGLEVWWLVLIFAGSAAAVWVAGIYVSDSTDVLSSRLGLGEALGGMLLLSIVTNLPEIAITTSAALHHDLGLAIGNILGGIAMQTLVLVALDFFGLGSEGGLSYRAASLGLVLEGTLVIAVLTVAILGHELPASLIYLRMTPAALSIVCVWVTGIFLVSKARKDLPWQRKGDAPGGQEEARGHSRDKKSAKGMSTTATGAIFLAGALVTLASGFFLELSGEALAAHLGMSGVIFGATVLAAATSLPEVSTGLAAVKLGDYKLAMSDIFGGNAFLPVLFCLATLLSGEAVLPKAQRTDVYLAALGMLLTCIYLCGLIFRPRRQIARMGIDSLVVLIVYAIGIAGLFAISNGG
ncbi:MAG: sodium:calcium antiporter [Chthoniobacterales bacterium]